MKKRIMILYPQDQEDIYSILSFNFKNADFLSISKNYTPFEREDLASKINKEYEQVYFYDYYDQFYLLLPLISKKVKRKYIINNSISIMSEEYFFNSFLQVLEYKKRGLLDAVASTCKELAQAFDNIDYIQLDVEVNKFNNNKGNNISIIGYDYLEKVNFYNQLGGIALAGYNNVIVMNSMTVTNNFGKDYNLNITIEKDIDKVIQKSSIALYVSFTDIDSSVFLRFMDNEIPCIVGNTSLLDGTKMSEYLCVDSDDSIDEIAEKIKECISNKEKIFKEYKEWRKNYSIDSRDSIKDFMNYGG